MDERIHQANWAENLEEQDEYQVRLLLSNRGYPPGMRRRALEWLTRQNRERRAKEAAVLVVRAARARRANTRDKIVTVAAMVAASVAMLGAVILFAAWVARLN
jgi:hypothetical protein